MISKACVSCKRSGQRLFKIACGWYSQYNTHYPRRQVYSQHTCNYHGLFNESTTGADASVEALKLYHMKLTLA